MIKRKLHGAQWLLLVVFLVLPAITLLHLTLVSIQSLIGVITLLIYTPLISIISYRCCKFDKNKAQTGQWRTPEASLHFYELIGGWPGSFIAQRRFRHKISKSSYQIMFWLIVIIHQAAAVNYLFDGLLVNSLISHLK